MKYMGSKNRLAKEILPVILKNRKTDQYYVEPFVGGANVIDKVKGNRIGADINNYMISLLKSLSNGWLPPLKITNDQFLDIKNNKENYPEDLVGYVGTQLSFGSVWFCSFRKDNGGKRCYSSEAYRNVLKQAPNLKGIEFVCSDYLNLQIPDNSIIYCDPPYKGTDKYRGFENIDHDKFWEWCRSKKREGHEIYISEFEAPEDFICIWEKKVNTLVAERSGGKNVTEKIFTL